MHYCDAPNIDKQAFYPTCHNWIADDQERCWVHGGPQPTTETRKRTRQATQRLRAAAKAEHTRAVYEAANATLDAKARRRKVVRWMLRGGGGEAFAEFSQSLQTSQPTDTLRYGLAQTSRPKAIEDDRHDTPQGQQAHGETRLQRSVP